MGNALNSSPKTHLGAGSCYRLRPRSDAVSESAALLRSSHRLSSPRRNPLFERDVRSNRRSNSLYLAATLGGCGAFVVKDFLTPLFQHCCMIIDHMAIPTILQTAQIKTGNDWKQSVDWVGSIFNYCDLPLVVFGRKERKNSVVLRQTKTKSNPMIKVTLEVSSKVNFGFR